ncbi:PAS domain-containing sensor histidine kinase [Halorhabdus sp. BNX81]|uniref:two-component system sensor histidine kinase NtrB n=1 Tax=Halorhabdus sp. BNX81 TaxID=2980181 RepID=UPI0023DD0767|nr:PAS domain-containing sensor histidine kinase [Halorhabdus sp. BNX81]
MGNTPVGHERAEPSDDVAPVAQRLVESIDSHAIFMLDSDGAITEWPPPATAMYGYDAERVLGEDVSSLFTDGDGSEAGDPPDGFLDDATEGTVEVEHWHERADESVFWGTLTLSPLSGDDEGFAAISHDETTAKEYERMLERQNDRLKEFTDILAHDLRNPLSVIDGNLALYEETGDDAHIETIKETTDRMARLVEDLLRVARQGDVVTDPEPTDIGEVVEKARPVVDTTAGGTFVYHEVPTVSGDADRLCQLFENLFRNAVEHSSTSPDSQARQNAVEHGSASPDTHTGGGTPGNSGTVTITVGPLETGFYVEDDGPGIPDEQKEDVFDHGFTTSGDGSGYGLSVVRTIVNAHGWDILVTDSDTGGARFEITGIDFLE